MRKIQSPDVEINEIDRSGRVRTNYSLPNAPVVLQFGFADQGNDYNVNWVNTKQSFVDKYGYPTNDPESYLYNSTCEVLNRGGIALVSKLPYANNSYNKYTYSEYDISNVKTIEKSAFEIDEKYITVGDLRDTLQKLLDFLESTSDISTLGNMSKVVEDLYNQYINTGSSVINTILDIRDKLHEIIEHLSKYSEYWLLYFNDSNITSYIELTNFKNGWSDVDEVDKLLTYSTALQKNKLRIYDISRQKYDKYVADDGTHFISSQTSADAPITYTDDFLGIVPVVVSPANAMFFQDLLNVDELTENNMFVENKTQQPSEVFNPISTFRPIDFKQVNSSRSYRDAPGEIGTIDSVGDGDDPAETFDQKISKYLTINLSSDTPGEQSLSKIASDQFKLIDYTFNGHFNTKYLKNIGIVVFKAFKDQQNNGKISFSLLESFVGSLDKTAKDDITHASIFIDTIVNENSNYIRVFSNIDRTNLQNASIATIKNQTATSLGFYTIDSVKDIDFDLSINKALTLALDRIKDPNVLPLDIIVDAGMSNIAQVVNSVGGKFNFDNGKTLYDIDGRDKSLDDFYYDKFNLTGWKHVLKKLDNHCKNVRKDCVFIADGLRSFCIDGNQKIVRKTNISKTIDKDILPKLKYMNCLNSSYSAGYCNWFWTRDEYTGDFFWCPPSIKAAGIYVYCDTFFHTWDAPAGMTRGIVNNVYDTAFTPDEVQAGKIYNQQWNYAVNYPFNGIILEGQKTFQTAQTALDRINVRRLMLFLEKRVRQIAKMFVYEENTQYVRQSFVDAITPIFEAAKNGYGISDYIIKCDDDINTIDTIENHELHCRIAVKPIKAIEFIICDFIIVNQSMSVSEEVNK